MKINKGSKIIIIIVISLFIFLGGILLFMRKTGSTFYDRKESSYTVIGLAQAKERFDNGSCLFIDARRDLLFKLGHIKNSINIPPDNFYQFNYDLKNNYPKSKKIIIYCGGSLCSSSYRLANLLLEKGFFDIEIFFRGWDDWVSAGYPTEQVDNLEF